MDTKTKAEDILCPICGNPVHVYGPEDWTPSFTDPDSGGDRSIMSVTAGFLSVSIAIAMKRQSRPSIGQPASRRSRSRRLC